MPLNNAAKAVMLNALAGVAAYASLHSADPGATGVSEIAGGAPGYGRKLIDWAVVAAGNLDDDAVPAFDVPPLTTVTHFGLWSAAVGGTFYGGDLLSAAETFTGQGTYTLTDLDVLIA